MSTKTKAVEPKQLRMEDVFESKEDGTIKAIGFPPYWSDEKCIAAYQAINNHDSMLDKITELESQNERLIDVMLAMKKDLLMRAEIEEDGCKVVNVSSTAWENFKEAI